MVACGSVLTSPWKMPTRALSPLKRRVPSSALIILQILDALARSGHGMLSNAMWRVHDHSNASRGLQKATMKVPSFSCVQRGDSLRMAVHLYVDIAK